MNFTATMSRRAASMARFFTKNAAGTQLKIYFPNAPGKNPGTFPNAILCQEGTTSNSDRDLLTGINRKGRIYTVSFTTASLPADFKNTNGHDKIPKDQVVRIGYTTDQTITYTVSEAESQNGITVLKLDQLQ
jgi:hypothetical protein